MKALVDEECGVPDALMLVDGEPPQPGHGKVLVRVADDPSSCERGAGPTGAVVEIARER
ncbi:MAG TPA: hypothetical protein PLS53_16550 [Thermoanaerobaculaceae bacterium]|nr:hypothetical protein [Thermoanaerobaculaceae bacterium]HPS79771.1 hypothetical protein [Thermoanaerobaculaceae bacterium]